MKKLLLFLVFVFPLLVFSQQDPIKLFKQFNGRYDFTAFGNTLNEFDNSVDPNYCSILSQSSATLNLSLGQTLVSAHLYWGSIGNGDFEVDINGSTINAERSFKYIYNSKSYFSAYSDVTNLVSTTGSGEYTFSGLDVSGIINQYCGSNFGGWAIYVIYEDSNLLQNQISLFDGLDGFYRTNPSLNITLTGISVSSDILSKIGFLAWEGDRENDLDESLNINGLRISNPPLNPATNLFNGTNSYVGSPENDQSYNMDLDYFDLVGIVEPGDTTIQIELHSGFDFIMINNVITSVNSELPDATISIDNLGVLCQDRKIEVNYTVSNLNSTALLPKDTPIAFYIDNNIIIQTKTVNDIPIDGTESGTVNLTLPIGTPPIFDLKVVVDDDGTGNGIVLETNEDNNEAEQEVNLSEQGLSIIGNNESCEGKTETLTANFTDLDTYNWFLNGVAFGGNSPTIQVTQSGNYTVSGNKGACFVDESPLFIVTFNPQPIANAPVDLFRCNNGTQTEFFNLTQNDFNVLGAQDPALFEVKYFTTEDGSENNEDPIPAPGAYPITGPTPQTIYVRIHDRAQEICYALEQFEIYYTPVYAGTVPSFALCDQDKDGIEQVKLSLEFDTFVLDGQNASDYKISYHSTQNDADTGLNPLPYVYDVPVPGQTIFIRIEPKIDSDCYATTTVDIAVDSPPVINEFPDPLVACDSDSNGFTDFFLHSADDDITNGDLTLSVTYHYTESDAQTNEGILPEPFENIIPYNDKVWARVESANLACYNTVKLDLEVRDSPALTEPTDYRICDDNNDGFEIFDFTTKEDEILNGLDPLQYDLYYYVLEQDAIDAGMAALDNPDFSKAIGNIANYPNIVPNAQTIYVLGVGSSANTTPNNGAQGCYDIVELQLIVDPMPDVVEPEDYHLCDDTLNGSTSTDQISTFNLPSRDLEITGGVSGVFVTWFKTFADEATDTPIIGPEEYQNTTNAETVVARVTNGFGCKDLVTLTLVVDFLPTPAQPAPLELCDEGGGFAEFDLSRRTVEIINGDLDVEVKYYPTEAEAEVGDLGEITAPFLYTNIIPFNDFVWARVEKNGTGCYVIVKLELIVIPLPDAPDSDFMDEYIVCDLNGDGFGIFDLTEQNVSVLGIQNPADFAPITYYRSLIDAQTDNDAIDPADAFRSAGQTVYVRLESLITTCFRITPFELIVSDFPVHGDAIDLISCDDEINGSTNNDGISTFDLTKNTLPIRDGDPTLTVLYYASQSDLDDNTPINNTGDYQNNANPQEIFVSITGQNACNDVITFFLIVNPNPEPVTPTTLFGCDVDNNGITFFNLETKNIEIQGGNPDLIITYHLTPQDAIAGNDPLVSPYENIVLYNQTVFVRAAYDIPPVGTGCYTIVELELEVIPTPKIPQDLPDLTACEDDGFHKFNLLDQKELIFGNQSQDDYTLTYHLNEVDAIAGTPSIAQPENYTNITNPQTIWVRLDNNNTECYKVGSFDLVVSSGLPIVDPEPFVKCDDLGLPFDGITTFDLTEKSAEITDGVLTQGVLYFLNEVDAQENINAINPDTEYENVENPQIIFVRVEDSNSECIAFTTLTLKVVSNPEPVKPAAIEICDVNVIIPPGPYDEVELFDLTIREGQILNGNTNWDLSYFESYDEAVNQNGEILDPDRTAYQNISNPQIIYVRVTNPDSTCFEIVELELIVNPLPDDSADISPYIICAADDSEIGVFNLENKASEILGQQTNPPFEVKFYLTKDDAENQNQAIVNTTAHQNKDVLNNPINPQTIYVGILNTETGCYIGGNQSFELIVQRGGIAVAPTEPFVICDNLPPIDGYAQFDLEDLSNQQVSDLRVGILAGQDPTVYGITFYETVEEADLGINPITFPYTNIINPQRIYVRVTNDDNQYEPKCYAVVDMILKVEQLPEIFLDGDYRLCVDENGNPIIEEEGSMSPPVIDTDLDPALFTFVWDLDGVIIPGETSPSIIALQGGVYTVTYTELASGCDNSVSATVSVSSPPLIYEAKVVNGAFAGNHVIEVTATGEGTYHYQLDDGPFQDSPIFENVTPGTHIITIKDINGCGSVTIEVGVIDYPLYFTPNNDGYHDTWNIIGIATGDPQAKIYIFDRFGKLLKQLSPLGSGWDGTYNGNPLPSSDYWFRVEYTEDGQSKEFKGHFTLKR